MSLAVENNRLVTLWVRMADMTGKTMEESPEEGLTYWHGHGDIFPKIEAALEGRFPGECFTIHLEPHDAFGEYDCDAIVMTDVANLGDPATVVPGLVFEEVPGVVSDGRLWRVTDVADGKAVLEANHPLAGIGLQFAIRVLKVEEPDESEGLEERPVVPGFLQVADKLVAEDDEEDLSDEEMDRMLENRQAAEPDTSSMAKLAKAPRIIR